ncbi:sucrose transport protein suc2 [Phtheirospermum japonicum]|uniref:Sucrose transport protein suc2 n=1 Tax=Phtheirospermum japonicum TaxID=374723 RepID=A0A830B3F9_9LAMI|nr:sucrose transport protein suc2 [Phtheirospermum japonicum]
MVYLDVIDSKADPQTQLLDRATLRKLILVASIAAGVQFGWALQLSLLTPYTQLLGLGHKWASLVWLCGPISGLVVQVIVGHHSDRCASSFGRRRPFILGGAISLSFGVLCIGYAADLGQLLGDSTTSAIRHRAATIFVIGFWLLDISNNIIQGPTRALLADISDGNDALVTIGNALFAFFMAVGNIMGYAAGASEWLHRYLPFTTTHACDLSCAHIKTCFLLSIVLIGVIVALVVVFIKEEPMDPFYLDYIRESCDETAPSFFMQILIATKETSRPMWVLYVVTAFNWIGIFPFLLYDTDWMGKEVYGGKVMGSREELHLYHSGVRAGSMGLVLHVLTMGAVSLFLEPMIRLAGNIKRLWSVGNIMLAICMALTVVISVMAEIARKGALSALGTSLVPPPIEVKVYCYGLFALFGIPQAVSCYYGMISILVPVFRTSHINLLYNFAGYIYYPFCSSFNIFQGQ